MSAENTVKLLWDCAHALEPDTHTKNLLKSHYINICRKIAKNNIQVPKEKFAVSKMCPRCSVLWHESDFHLKLKPQQLANSAKAKKLIAKLEEAISTRKKGLLTKKQRQRAKWLKKRVCSNVEIRCENCKQKTLVPLQKPPKTVKLKESSPSVDVEPEPVPKAKKKKKKNKNKTAGLKITQNILQPKQKNTKEQMTKINEHKPKVKESYKVAAETSKIKTDKNIDKPLPSLSQNLKTKKKKKNKPSTQTAVVLKPVQSKTQQKNSLLQLAALLKTQSKKSNTAQNRLETLLK